MKQLDWVGDLKPPKPFKDIRSTRDAVAEEKATLVLALGELINKIPTRIKTGGTVDDVRAWRRDVEACRKVAANQRSSCNELRSAIGRMEVHWK